MSGLLPRVALALSATLAAACLDPPDRAEKDGPDAGTGDGIDAGTVATCSRVFYDTFNDPQLDDGEWLWAGAQPQLAESALHLAINGEAGEPLSEVYSTDLYDVGRHAVELELTAAVAGDGAVEVRWDEEDGDLLYAFRGTASGVDVEVHDEVICAGCATLTGGEQRWRLVPDGPEVAFDVSTAADAWERVAVAPAVNASFRLEVSAQVGGPGDSVALEVDSIEISECVIGL